MPPVGPVKRRDLLAGQRSLDITARSLVSGTSSCVEPSPNPHRGEISRGLLVRILREAGFSREQWESI